MVTGQFDSMAMVATEALYYQRLYCSYLPNGKLESIMKKHGFTDGVFKFQGCRSGVGQTFKRASSKDLLMPRLTINIRDEFGTALLGEGGDLAQWPSPKNSSAQKWHFDIGSFLAMLQHVDSIAPSHAYERGSTLMVITQRFNRGASTSK